MQCSSTLSPFGAAPRAGWCAGSWRSPSSIRFGVSVRPSSFSLHQPFNPATLSLAGGPGPIRDNFMPGGRRSGSSDEHSPPGSRIFVGSTDHSRLTMVLRRLLPILGFINQAPRAISSSIGRGGSGRRAATDRGAVEQKQAEGGHLAQRRLLGGANAGQPHRLSPARYVSGAPTIAKCAPPGTSSSFYGSEAAWPLVQRLEAFHAHVTRITSSPR